MFSRSLLLGVILLSLSLFYLSANQAIARDIKTATKLYIFVSFSLPEKTLENLVIAAKKTDAIVTFKGAKNNSLSLTLKAIEKYNKYGAKIIIDPKLFSIFAIENVPSFVLADDNCVGCKITPLHDRITGDISLIFALEMISLNGSMADNAAYYLNKIRGQQ